MTENYMLLDREGCVATITINRPDQRNAMLSIMWKWLAETMENLNDDNDVRCVVIRGAGDKAFASGADISEFEVWTSHEKAREYGGLIEYALQAIGKHRNPVIAMVQGFALGAGCELAVACDLRVLADVAKIGIPSAKLGVMLNYENYQRVVDLAGISVAREIFFVGRQLDAQRAREVGLANFVVPKVELEKFTYELAQEISGNAPLSVRGSKRVLQACGDHGMLDRDRDADLLAQLDELSATCFLSEDVQEGVSAFFGRRKADFKGK
ncbi:MAG: enoyl-CoA hydratase/isomerase family protein [Candidatus Lindowbacteria bacterium]|nr:enoyl-CoA hydratase/isomerase family protein [Candidatus Lindowbacteria bacterium]